MNFITNKTFTDEDVILCDNDYTACTFLRCRLIYDGTGATGLHGNTIDESPFFFKDAAGSTLNFLSGLYQSGAKDVVEKIFTQIRLGNFARENEIQSDSIN